jgi:hypothetical protein
MKPIRFVILVLCSLMRTAIAHAGIYQQGTVIRMHVGECTLVPHHGFMATLSGAQPQQEAEICPEYTLVTDKVVYVIVGKSSNQLIPLAESIDFRFQNNEIAVRVDDAKHESRFAIKAMMLRSEWERAQPQTEDETSDTVRLRDGSIAMRNR